MRVLTAPTQVYADYTRVPTTLVPGPGPTKTRVSTAATRVYTAYTTRVPTAATLVHTACTIATRVPTVATRTRVYTVSRTWISSSLSIKDCNILARTLRHVPWGPAKWVRGHGGSVSWAPPRTPIIVVSRVCDPARDTLRPERSREAVTFRVIGLREVISRECDCTKLPVPRGAAAAAYARSIRGKWHCTTRACAV